MSATQKEAVYAVLTDLGIPYEQIDHPAAFTVDDIERVDFPEGIVIAKNLFLRDAKGKRHFLVVAAARQTIHLKELGDLLQSTKLSFASEDRLQKHLGLTKGSVSPFGLLNDTEGAVEVYVDAHLKHPKAIGLHPNDNTSTLLVTYEHLLRFIAHTGHVAHTLQFE